MPDGRYTLQFGFDAEYPGEPGLDAVYFTGNESELSADAESAATVRIYGNATAGIQVELDLARVAP